MLYFFVTYWYLNSIVETQAGLIPIYRFPAFWLSGFPPFQLSSFLAMYNKYGGLLVCFLKRLQKKEKVFLVVLLYSSGLVLLLD